MLNGAPTEPWQTSSPTLCHRIPAPVSTFCITSNPPKAQSLPTAVWLRYPFGPHPYPLRHTHQETSFFEHDFLFVPISERKHWIVVVICCLRNLFDGVDKDSNKPSQNPRLLILVAVVPALSLACEPTPASSPLCAV